MSMFWERLMVVLFLAVVVLFGAEAEAQQPVAQLASPTTTAIPEEKYRPLLRNWEHGATPGKFTVLAVNEATGEATIKFIARNGREVPMAGRVSIDPDGTLRLKMRGGVNVPIELDLEYRQGKLVGTLRTVDQPVEALFWPTK